jgi:peptidoglycan/xylan/chitin deacetylase (PgdA/CDA1 family)
LHRNENPFGVGIPLIMGSNNYASSLVSQCNLYRRFTGDSTFVDMEMSLNDWLFGCNPWGISMVIGLPETANAPKEPFSALSSSFQIPINGGLISGPVNNDVYRNQIDIQLSKADVYAQFQTNWAVYHDDEVDYLTNEPTLDATASLLYFLSSKQFDGAARRERDSNQYYKSALVRTNKAKKQISLVFSANQFADGKADILHALDKLDAKASFFLTGDFLRNRHYKKIVEEILAKGHYVGAHSDKYLQYCDVKNRETLLLTKEEFKADLKRNYDELARFGVTKQEAPFFLPPYGLSNDSISRWCKEFGVVLVNNTAGTISSADITIPEMRENYYSSLEINNQIMTLEAKEGLNGYILLFHLGTDIRRADKFYERIYKLLSDLKKKGYEFSDLHESSNLLTKYKKPEKKKRKNN